ncbi:Co-chaperone Hsc20 [Nemania serpens]|nr:Co-chaperone Hsc20 [Nemania serpens]
MRASVFPARQAATRLCAFCQQQQQRRGITTARSLHASISSPRRHGVSDPALASSPRPQPHLLPPTPTAKTTTRRSISTSSDSQVDAAPKEAPQLPQTHYEFFPRTLPDGPPPRGRFRIDTRELRREFLKLQTGAHPDLHPAQRGHALSARINEAYRTLASALTRAQYVLALRGRDVANDETASVRDPDLLSEVLEARETIEEAEGEDDLVALREENEERIRRCEDRLERLFAKDDLEGATDEVVKLRYWVNVRESIDNWEEGKPVVLEH